MNRIWAAIAILVILFAACVWEVNKTNDITVDMTITLTEIQDAIGSNDTEKAADLCKSAIDSWKKYHYTLSFFVPHERLEEISETLSTMYSFLQSGTEDEARAECNRAIDQLRTLRDTEMPFWNNIF